MSTIEDTFGERMTLTRAAEYIGIDRRQLKKVYRSFGGFDHYFREYVKQKTSTEPAGQR